MLWEHRTVIKNSFWWLKQATRNAPVDDVIVSVGVFFSLIALVGLIWAGAETLADYAGERIAAEGLGNTIDDSLK